MRFFISNYFGKFKLSVDTMNYEIARYALENNFEIVNDVSGFNDLKMIQLIVGCNKASLKHQKRPQSL